MNENLNIPEDISILIIEFLEGNIADENLSRLNLWLKEDEAHLKQFNALKSVWLMNSKALPYETLKIDSELNRVKDKIAHKIKPEIRHLWTFKKVAASWIVFLVAGGLLGMLVSREKTEPSLPALTTITAPVGAKSIVDLPDGSKVWINAGSTITYNNSFGKQNRDLKLVGEAYFSVKTNPSLPFIVKTSDIMVKALGTKFNVKAYPEEKTITTTLEEGKIIVTSLKEKSPDKVVELKPREMITFIKQPKKPAKTDTQQESVNKNSSEGVLSEIIPEVKTELQTSWKDATWIIEGKTLGDLAPMLERRYNVVISFEKTDIKQFKFTGKIQNETIEQILMAIELSSPVKFSISNNNISLLLNKALLDEYSQNTN
jgi:ferric-dicitrate binding protein FerR (iron transport regulator)